MPRSTPRTQPAPQADPAHVAPARARLLRWYRRHARELPWRKHDPATGRPNPYRVLVSEAMLQQTRVDTALPYFERFLHALPTLADLAAADEQQVLRLWQGLGYYRRARNLRSAAIHCAQHHQGELPDTADQLRNLPGVGRYTAGAVASIAFGRREPIVDGNVARVLSRWRHITTPLQAKPTQDTLWTWAGRFVENSRNPGDVNQALMELGATVCTPRAPKCQACPLKHHCLARAQGEPESLPLKDKAPPLRVEHHQVVAIRRNHQLLWLQRPDHGLWSAMWQMPTREAKEPASAQDLADWLKETTGLVAAIDPEPVERFEHLTTHKRLRYAVHLAHVESGRLRPGAGVWRASHNVDDLPLPNPQRRTLAILAKAGTPTGSEAR
ncbi:MAG: A/G-specific adenine glycosylase [Planctomycetota bacterium]